MEICNHKLVSYPGDNLTALGTIKLPVKSEVDQELTFDEVKTNQPGLLGFRFSETLGLIKVLMMAKKEQEETTPDDNDQVTCTKTSQELKEEVRQKYACVYRIGAVRKTLPH